MTNLRYSITINAPKQKVWQLMLGQDTYKEWTGAFHSGSSFVGSWDKGSKIKFVAEDGGKINGMFGKIVENVPYKFVSIEQLGEIINGEEDTSSPNAQQWIGSHENYSFSEVNGVTTLEVELIGEGINSEIAEMFNNMWPAGLAKLKEISER